MRTFKKDSDPRPLRPACPAWLALCATGLLAVSGCSSSGSSKPMVGAISFTDANGTPQAAPLTSLTVSQGTYLEVALTHDSRLLGADWSVACGSALPPGAPLPPGLSQDQSCGTFTPTHTMSGPVPGFVASATGYVTFYNAPPTPPKEGVVTLYASATADHTRLASVTLSINGLPISVGFAPAPPVGMGTNASAQLRVVLNNDASNAGVTWSLLCASAACGSIGPVQTPAGVATTYSAPASVPPGGTVKITATSVADPTKSVSATVQIAPISISVTPTALSVPTAGTGSVAAIVTNDASNRGVDWSVSCTNTLSPGNCGTITAHTASGGTATYTAPSIANIAVANTVTITATSTANPAQSAVATVTTTKGNLISGVAHAAQQPVSGAQVTLYAAATSESTLATAQNASNMSAQVAATTDQDGNFYLPYGYQCPTPDTQIYLVSTVGNAGGGTNPNLALMVALGSCSGLDSARFEVNEVTTAAAVYALSSFMGDERNLFMNDEWHVGSSQASPTGMIAAFATARNLVDPSLGVARQTTVSGAGIAPQVKLNTLANLVSACARTAGSVKGDGSVCDRLFGATNAGTTPSTQASNTIQALLHLARNASGFANHPDAFGALYPIAASTASFEPALSTSPSDWTLAIQFPNGPAVNDRAALAIPLANSFTATTAISSAETPASDAAGNLWVGGSGRSVTEFIGGASCAALPSTLTLPAAGSGARP